MKYLSILILILLIACNEEAAPAKVVTPVDTPCETIVKAGFQCGGLLTQKAEFSLLSYTATNTHTPGILYQIRFANNVSIYDVLIIGNSNILYKDK